MSEVSAPILPEITPEAIPYWEGALEGKLLYQRCTDCESIQFPFQTICRNCLSSSVEAVVSSGKGTIVSFTTIYRAPSPSFADQVPYTVLLVKLEEGYTMMSSLLGADPDDVEIGQQVEVAFKQLSEDCALPCFRLARKS